MFLFLSCKTHISNHHTWGMEAWITCACWRLREEFEYLQGWAVLFPTTLLWAPESMLCNKISVLFSANRQVQAMESWKSSHAFGADACTLALLAAKMATCLWKSASTNVSLTHVENLVDPSPKEKKPRLSNKQTNTCWKLRVAHPTWPVAASDFLRERPLQTTTDRIFPSSHEFIQNLRETRRGEKCPLRLSGVPEQDVCLSSSLDLRSTFSSMSHQKCRSIAVSFCFHSDPEYVKLENVFHVVLTFAFLNHKSDRVQWWTST